MESQETTKQALSTVVNKSTPSIYASMSNFEDAQRIAQSLSASSLVPEAYRGNMANTLIALEMANRMGDSPFQVMQNLDIIHGKPGWKSTYIIAKINSCGKFSTPLRFTYTGEKGTDTWGCIAHAKDQFGETLESDEITIKMAKDEGWYSRKDKYGKETSKWQTMPKQMLSYRAASFFGKLYCPEILAGMQTAEETFDIQHEIVDDKSGAIDSLNKSLSKPNSTKTPAKQAKAAKVKKNAGETVDDVSHDPNKDDENLV
jgi:hypothetical protein